jgi:hypothetical protein
VALGRNILGSVIILYIVMITVTDICVLPSVFVCFMSFPNTDYLLKQR